MKRNRTTSLSRRRTIASVPASDLPVDRAFVLHLDAGARLPDIIEGRLEHVTSGQVGHVSGLPAMLAFMAEVLRSQAPCERGVPTRPGDSRRSGLEPGAPGAVAGSAAEPPPRRRTR